MQENSTKIKQYLHDTLLIAFKFAVACNSDCPPDKKVTPGTAAGTVLLSAVTVASPISSGVALFACNCPKYLCQIN